MKKNLLFNLTVTARKAEGLHEERTLVRDLSGAVRELRADDWLLEGTVSGTVPGTSYGYDTPFYGLPPHLELTGGEVLRNGSRERDYLGAPRSASLGALSTAGCCVAF